MESKNDSEESTSKSSTQQKIRILEDQLVFLDHYLPETYDYPMQGLDIQRRVVAELESSETFQVIDRDQFADS